MTYNDIWRRLAKVYPDNEAKAISRLLMEDLFGLSLSDIICGAADRLSDDSCRVLEEAVQSICCFYYIIMCIYLFQLQS